MQIHINSLVKTDITDLHKYVSWSQDRDAFLYPIGNQHYKLFAYISTILPPGSKILEIGTRWGSSAAAFSRNEDVHVFTCDLEDQLKGEPSIKDIQNVTFMECDGFDVLEEYINCDLIFIDVDPHDGVQEVKMIQRLKDLNFKGILLLDDINLNPEMQMVWNSITLPKFDLTKLGHYSGTGIVFFGNQDFSILHTMEK